MKTSITKLFFCIFLITIGCTQTSKENQETEEEDPNKKLYEQVMDIHDEVMPSMDELYSLKRQLNDKIANSPDLVEEKRKDIDNTIHLIDSASRGMMTWMNEFKPEEHNDEDLRVYLESEMKRVQKVKDTMLDAIEKGKKALQ